MTARQPSLFIGHGSPMLAITDNPFRHAWRALGERLPRPRAVLCVSAHWETATPQVCTATEPRTLHDFGGFPAELFAQQYPAPGAPWLLTQAREALASAGVLVELGGTDGWGLDHGAWAVLQSLFPQADVPVAQFSLARGLSPARHVALARGLRALRDQGVMVLGSGNTVHNLRELAQAPAHDWNLRFDAAVVQALTGRDDGALAALPRRHPDGALACPTLEHYLPLLYVAGVRHEDDVLSFPVEGDDLASLNMRSVMLA